MEKNLNDIEKLRHSASHILAQAIIRLYPGVKLGIGPSIEDGFYYDFADLKINESDFPKIEAEMKKIIKENHEFKKITKTKKEAEKILKNQPYKLELLDDLEGEITFYEDGEFIDLCAGPHVKHTGEIKAVKLLKVAGAYWKGSEKNDMLIRIYGTAFSSQKELDDYLKLKEEAEKRDHRKLGKELELFFFSDLSPGAPFWQPKGMIIVKELEKYWREIHDSTGYQEISTPIMVSGRLFDQSGHTAHYKENMFNLKVDNKDFYLKPMNCPEATVVYSSRLRSYRELPLRLNEIGRLHRNELSGVLGGMFRVRQITMDDAHIFCTPDQINKEITSVLELIKTFYGVFGLKPKFLLSTKPDEAMGDSKLWEKAEKSLADALKSNGLSFELKPKDGAFYGPKIDIQIKDSLGRDWQMATIQLDFQMPEKFELTYEGSDNTKHRVVMIHRAIFGSFERFIGVITEHFAGKFPLWISPVQVIVMNITDKNAQYSKNIVDKLKEHGLRVEFDDRNDTISKKVRDAQLLKVNYMVTIGDKEEEKDTLAIRTRDGKVSFNVKIDDFIKDLRKEIDNKEIK
jgi:threonyl-tRNA synthetase